MKKAVGFQFIWLQKIFRRMSLLHYAPRCCACCLVEHPADDRANRAVLRRLIHAEEAGCEHRIAFSIMQRKARIGARNHARLVDVAEFAPPTVEVDEVEDPAVELRMI